jgi:hypothetical protein
MPETVDMEVGMQGRTPLVAHPRGDFYVAYPTGYPRSNRVRIWRVGAASARPVGRVNGSSRPAVAVAAADDGRIWVAWTEGFGDPDVLVRRSNLSATRFGATVNIGHPPDALQAYRLDASTSGRTLDVLGNFNIETSSDTATSYRRALAGLTLRTRPRTLRRNEATEVRVTVLDAGDPVKGATVRVAGAAGTTDAEGTLTLRVKATRSVTASATQAGYASASKRVEVRD